MAKALNRPTARKVFLPAPVKGWNTVTPVGDLSPNFATSLTNYICDPAGLIVREGSTAFATVAGSLLVHTMFAYGAQFLYAVTATAIYDITAGGAGVSAIATGSGLRGKAVNFSTSAGTYVMYLTDGQSPKRFDGTTWVSITGVGVGAITGIAATTTLFNATVYRQRMFFLDSSKLSFWYLPVDSIQGAAVEYPVGNIFKLGGLIADIATWTIDGGNGPDDYLVIYTTKGEIAVFFGSDPAVPANWVLQGVFQFAPPAGSGPSSVITAMANAFVKFGGDLLIFTTAGVFPLSKLLTSVDIDRSKSISYNIQPTLMADLEAQPFLGSNFWGIFDLPSKQLLLLNAPTNTTYAMQGITKGWSALSGFINSSRIFFFEFQGRVYASSATSTIARIFTGFADNVSTITVGIQTAYTRFGMVGESHITQVQPVLAMTPFGTTGLGATLTFLSVGTDFAGQFVGQAYTNPVYASPNFGFQNPWHTVACWPGMSHAIRLQIDSPTSGNRFRLLGFNVLLDPSDG